MLIVYRKSDGEIVFNSGKSFITPNGITDENGFLATIEQIGGSYSDYGTYRLHDVNDKPHVDELIKYTGYVTLLFNDNQAVGYVIDYDQYELDIAKAIFDENNRPPTEVDNLKKETIILSQQIKASADIAEFHEELIAELAMMLYS